MRIQQPTERIYARPSERCQGKSNRDPVFLSHFQVAYVGVSFLFFVCVCLFFNWRDYSSFFSISLFSFSFRENNKGFWNQERPWDDLNSSPFCVCVVPFGFDRNRHQRYLAADVGTGRCDRSARCGVCGVYSSSAKNLRVSIILDRVNVHYCPVFHMSNGR